MKLLTAMLVSLVMVGCAQREVEAPRINTGWHIAVPAEQVEQPTFTADDRLLVQMVLADLVINERVRSSIDFYAPKTRTLLLRSFGSPIEWPKDFLPLIDGWTVLRDPTAIAEATALGVDIRAYRPAKPNERRNGAGNEMFVIQMALYSAINIGTIGAADVTYEIDRKTRTVRFLSLEDA